MHGYQLIQEIAQRSDGVWRPSAGSVYPALSLLEDEGLVRPQVAPDDEGGKKVFVLTEAGQAYVTEHATELADPWDTVTGGVSDAMAELMGLIREVHGAAIQVLRTGDTARVERARSILVQTRRSLYLVLAGDDPAGDGDEQA
jgi:DNA-binding PadR family transcriptional regulator